MSSRPRPRARTKSGAADARTGRRKARPVAVRKLTQVEAAKLFGVSQPRISDLRRNKIDRFTVDALINMLARAGVSVVLKIGRPAA